MSHFTVLVIGPNPEEQLAPFDENICVEPYPEYQDEDSMRRMLSHYHIDTIGDITPEMAKDWWGTDNWGINEQGVYRMSTDNPNSKWDWYELGGRWTGAFKLKPNHFGKLGKPGAFGNEPREADTVDQAPKGSIDFEKMRMQAKAHAIQTYDLLERVTAGLPLPESWDAMREANPDIGQARKAYHAQPWIKAVTEVEELDTGIFGGPAEKVYCALEENGRNKYITRAMDSVIDAYAIVKDGQWQGRGEMSWFGVSSNDQDEDTWNAKLWEIVNTLPDDTVLSLYDCHI